MTTYKAQLDDLMLDLVSVDDGGEKALIEYDIADADGSSFDDLGMKSRTFSCRAIFKNQSYTDYFKLKTIIEQKNIVHNFVHPSEGLLFVRVSGYQIRHDDRKNIADVDFTLKEQLQGNFESRISPLIQPQIEEMFSAGQVQAIDRLKTQILLAIGPGASGLVSDVVSTSQTLSSQFVTASRAVRAYVAQADEAMNAIAGFLHEIEQPADTLIASIEYGSTAPGVIIGCIARALDRYLTLVETAVESPVLVLQSFFSGAAELRNAAVGFEPDVDCLVAMAGTLLASRLYKSDDDAADAAAVVESTPAWNDNGEYIGKATAPVYMTVEELERSLFVVREAIQTAFEYDREITSLQEMAAQLLRHVNTIKIQREKTFTVDIATEMPLHLICHKYGVPQGRVDRVLSMNPQIRNPSFVSGEVVLYG